MFPFIEPPNPVSRRTEQNGRYVDLERICCYGVMLGFSKQQHILGKTVQLVIFCSMLLKG